MFAGVARRSIQAAARLFGYEIKRTRTRAPRSKSFYDVSPTCQMPALSFLYELFFGRRADGVFVEVGAFDGYGYSNTSCLADAGWKGFYIEPVPAFAELCRRRHAGNPRIEVIAAAIGPANGEATIAVGGPLSTANRRLADEYQGVSWAKREFTRPETLHVPQLTLDRFLSDRAVPSGFDLLNVDVEGYEAEVFSAFDLARWRPRMLIVELADTHPELEATRRSDARLSRHITDAGYVIVCKDAINTMFVADELFRETYELDKIER